MDFNSLAISATAGVLASGYAAIEGPGVAAATGDYYVPYVGTEVGATTPSLRRRMVFNAPGNVTVKHVKASGADVMWSRRNLSVTPVRVG